MSSKRTDLGSTPDPPSWNSVAQHLATLLASVGDISPDLSRRVPNDDLWQFKALIDTGEDIFMTTIVSLKAIDDLGKEPPKVQELWPKGGHDAEEAAASRTDATERAPSADEGRPSPTKR